MTTLVEKMAEEAARQKLAKSRNFAKTNWYKPNTGDNLIRILPHWSNSEELFFRRVTIHYSVPIPRDDSTGTVAIPVLLSML